MQVRSFTIVVAVLCILSAIGIGCSSLDMQRTEAELKESRAWLQSQREVAVTQDDTKTVAAADKLLSMLTRIETVLTTISDPNQAEQVAPSIANQLPPPWNLVVGLGFAAGVGLLQEARVRRWLFAAKSLINEVDVLRSEAPSVRTTMQDASLRRKMDAQLTPAAKKLIKQESLT